MPNTISYGALERNAAEKNIPINAHVELTNKCNFKCTHCYLNTNIGKAELTTDQFKYVFDQLAELGTLYLALTGGEILCRKDIFELAVYARKKQFALRLFTNGSLITKEVAQKFLELEPLFVEISLYGMTADTFERVTQIKGSFEKTLSGIHFLHGLGLNLILKMPVMTLNYDELSTVKKFADEIGAQFTTDTVISLKLDGDEKPVSYRIDNKQLQWVFTNINNGWTPVEREQNKTVCNAGKGIMAINPYGEVRPCLRIDTVAGNVQNQSLADIWHNSLQMKKVRELYLRTLHDCSHCSDTSYCNPCPGLGLMEKGDVHAASDECCRQARVRKYVTCFEKSKVGVEMV